MYNMGMNETGLNLIFNSTQENPWVKLVEIIAPFIFALIIFILTQNKENKRWEKSSFIERKQDVFIDYYDSLLDLKNNLSFITDEFFIYDTARFSDFVPENNKWDDYIDFDKHRDKLSEEITKIIDVFKEYSFSYNKFVTYFDENKVPNLNLDELNHFLSNLGTIESFIIDLNFICIATTEDKSKYYYKIDDFNWRLNKIRCSGESVLNALNNSGLISYLEKEIIV